MIVVFTDFGLEGPYVGQMKAVLHNAAPGIPLVDLMADAPAFDARAAAYLLAAYVPAFPTGAVFLAVVDPGVGGGRRPLVVEAGGQWFVGPDNGLLALAARRPKAARAWQITWRPPTLSASFHGRDLFAPVAARLVRGESPPGTPCPIAGMVGADWPEDLAEIVYLDRFGNAVTGLRADRLGWDAVLLAGGQRLKRASTFSDVAEGAAFWYENANGLVEIAANRARADRLLSLEPGDAVELAEGSAAND
jgi:S-adenosylmethionine hydrolase